MPLSLLLCYQTIIKMFLSLEPPGSFSYTVAGRTEYYILEALSEPDADLQVVFAVLDDGILALGQQTLAEIAPEYKQGTDE